MKLLGLEIRFHQRTARASLLVAFLLGIGIFGIIIGIPRGGTACIVLGGAVAAAYYFFVFRVARIPRGSVLMVRMAGAMREVAPKPSIDFLRGRRPPALDEVRQALEYAASDPKISTILVEIAGLEIGMAAAEELHALLAAARGRGKRVVALIAGDQAGVREYMVACGASEILVNPDTTLLMLGVAAGGVFVRDALHKAGIGVQAIQRKEYKGAAEIFTRDSMSPAVRESIDALLADWHKALSAAVAADRKISAEQAGNLLTCGFLDAKTARARGMIDREGYFEDVRGEILPDNDSRRLIPLGRYLRRASYESARPWRPARIALVHALGPVIAGEPPPGGEFISGEVTARSIRDAIDDTRIKAIVMRVNSPGGSAVGSDLVWRAVGEARAKGKPVVVSMGDVAASGGYYVAMSADAIVAQPSTVTGSIGVIYAKFNATELMARAGIATEFVQRGQSADAMSFARPFSAEEMAQLEGVVDRLYEGFRDKVAGGRSLSPDQAEAAARGRVWSGRAAAEKNLVDALGGLSLAISIARQKAGIPADRPHQIVTMPGGGLLIGMRSALMSLTGREESIIGSALGLPTGWLPALLGLLQHGGAMMLATTLFL
jgi:protease-4